MYVRHDWRREDQYEKRAMPRLRQGIITIRYVVCLQSNNTGKCSPIAPSLINLAPWEGIPVRTKKTRIKLIDPLPFNSLDRASYRD